MAHLNEKYRRWTVVLLVYAALVLDNVLLTVVGDKDHKQWVKMVNHE